MLSCVWHIMTFYGEPIHTPSLGHYCIVGYLLCIGGYSFPLHALTALRHGDNLLTRCVINSETLGVTNYVPLILIPESSQQRQRRDMS